MYLARTKYLRGGGGNSTQSVTQKISPHKASTNTSYKPHFQKTMAFVATTREEPDPTPADSEFETTEESNCDKTDHTSNDVGVFYIPEFLWEARDSDWGLTIWMV